MMPKNMHKAKIIFEGIRFTRPCVLVVKDEETAWRLMTCTEAVNARHIPIVVAREGITKLSVNELEELLRLARKSRTCRREGCGVKFMAKHENQWYCCKTCSKYAQKLQKLRWWKEHGAEWRAHRTGVSNG